MRLRVSVLLTLAALVLLPSCSRSGLYEATMDALVTTVDAALADTICIPVPADGGGGYTHEQHKSNYLLMNSLGQAWQYTGNEAYAGRLRDMLLAYADFYPSLPLHPLQISRQRGRLFFQTLNESVWLVHTAMAYDCIRDWLGEEDRARIEDDLLRQVAAFIMEGTPANRKVFNSMHNHGTWACAAVGMTGLAIGDGSLVEKALYGTGDGEGAPEGFLSQIDELFSPDGYYTEGAYYQRYAIWPFMMFGGMLERKRPGTGVFERNDGVLMKAVDALIQMSCDGRLFMFNDSAPKDLNCQELVCAVNTAYAVDPSRHDLLSIVRDFQDRVLPDAAGRKVSRDLAAGLAEPYVFRSTVLRDGAKGDRGAFAILRGRDGEAVTFKATSQGMGHGHFDRLAIGLYDNGNEILTDYGSARFVNVDAKYHGAYTPLNESYAKSTVAHNTVAVDCGVQFGGKWKKAEPFSPEILGCLADGGPFQYVAAREDNAVPGVSLCRWTALAEIPFLEHPMLLDVFEAGSESPHTYDCMFHYNGHMISLSEPYFRNTDCLKPFGTDGPYSNLWLDSGASGTRGCCSLTWMCADRMYTLTTDTSDSTELFLLRTGASDPDYILRSEPAFAVREPSTPRRVFASCLEIHGTYDLRTEQSANLEGSCTGVEVISDDTDGIKVSYSFRGGNSFVLQIDKSDNSMKVIL